MEAAHEGSATAPRRLVRVLERKQGDRVVSLALGMSWYLKAFLADAVRCDCCHCSELRSFLNMEQGASTIDLLP
jgi:hypothetical protein